MSTLKEAHVHNSRLMLDEPSDLPEGTIVELVVAADFCDELAPIERPPGAEDRAMEWFRREFEARGTWFSRVLALVEIHRQPAFSVACSRFDTSYITVFPRARDPKVGGRQLEQLAFQIVSTELLEAGHTAEKLVAVGVRRVFAIHVHQKCVLEWSASLGNWIMLDPGAVIEDPVFAVPLTVAALVDDGGVDDAVAHALIIKRNSVIEAAVAEGIARSTSTGGVPLSNVERSRIRDEREGVGRSRGERPWPRMAETLIELLEARGVAVGSVDLSRIRDERDPKTLIGWFSRAFMCTDIAEMFAEESRLDPELPDIDQRLVAPETRYEGAEKAVDAIIALAAQEAENDPAPERLKEIRAEGKAEGIAEGKARGMAESLIVLLEARDVALRAAERARILGERDPSMLTRWLTHAMTCTVIAEMLTRWLTHAMTCTDIAEMFAGA